MHFSQIRTKEDFFQFQQQWALMLPHAYVRSPFQTFEFLRPWWESRGGGEWLDPALWIGLIRNEGGELRGIAPLFCECEKDGSWGLHFLGANEIADYLDLIVRQEDVEELTEQVVEHAARQDNPKISYLDLNNIQQESPCIPAFIAAATRKGLAWSLEDEQVCPFIPLIANWEAYLSGLNKKQRHEIRRKMRRFEEYQQVDTFRIVQGKEAVEKVLPEFLDLMRKEKEKEVFLTAQMEKFFKSLISRGAGEGWVKLAVLSTSQGMAAAYLFFDYNRTIWLYNSGFDPAAQQLSPGWVLLSRLIQWGFENGKSELDFMRGDEAYKYRFGGIDRAVKRLHISLEKNSG
ncbi:MAG: GNAT family N-acetyltransferase [Anaerolineales bacterium]|nr:GNAT family N-acetyltransferase [Anaerolineales bacterium]